MPLPLSEESGFAFSARSRRPPDAPYEARDPRSPGRTRPVGSSKARAERRDRRVLGDTTAGSSRTRSTAEMLYDAEHDTIAAHRGSSRRTILLDGFSKTFAMTGWRLGYAAAEELVEPVTRLIINSVSCTAPAVQLAGVAAPDRSARRGERDADRVPPTPAGPSSPSSMLFPGVFLHRRAALPMPSRTSLGPSFARRSWPTGCSPRRASPCSRGRPSVPTAVPPALVRTAREHRGSARRRSARSSRRGRPHEGDDPRRIPGTSSSRGPTELWISPLDAPLPTDELRCDQRCRRSPPPSPRPGGRRVPRRCGRPTADRRQRRRRLRQHRCARLRLALGDRDEHAQGAHRRDGGHRNGPDPDDIAAPR